MRPFLALAAFAVLLAPPAPAADKPAKKVRVFLVSSYHPEYLWDQELAEGFCAGLVEFGLFGSKADCETLKKSDLVETQAGAVKRAWMDTKRRTSKPEMQAAADRIAKEIDAFKPDIIVVSDDNGTNYIGNKYLGSPIPVVFCGVDETPLKYGLIESIGHPGRNVTGVYQKGYYKDAAEALLRIAPDVRTFGILSDGSESGLAKVKGIQELAAKGELPLKLVDTISTNSFKQFQDKTLALAKKVDAFLLVNHNTMKDDEGKPVDQLKVGNWYLNNVRKPDFSSEKQFVQEGLLLVAEDSAYRQAYAALRIAFRILRRGDKPGDIAPQRPPRGPIIVNRKRAEMLGITVDEKQAEAFVDKALAL